MISDRKQILEILLVAYQNRFDAMNSFEDRYHNKFTYIFLYISVLGVIGSIVNSFKPEINDELFSMNPQLILFPIICFLIFLIFFLIALMMSDLYMVYMNSVGMKVYEEEINRILGVDVLIWNSDISLPKLFAPNKFIINKWVKPPILVGVIMSLTIAAILYLFGCICKLYIEKLFGLYVVIVLFSFTILVFQWWRLHTTGIQYLNSNIYLSEETINKLDSLEKDN